MSKNKSIALILFVVLMLSLVLTACQSSTKTDGNTPADSSPSAQASEEREMVVGIPTITSAFKLFDEPGGYEILCQGQVYQTLLKLDSKGLVSPGVADKWEISEDAMTYKFHVREGVMWSNGTELTADDVIWSIEQLVASPVTSWAYKPMVESITKIDKYNLELKLTKPSVSFIQYLCDPFYCGVLCKNAVEEMGEEYGTAADKIVSCGPYRVVEWQYGQYIRYEANEDFYGGAPDVKKLLIKVYASPNTAVIALKTGEIDLYMDNIPGVNYADLKTAENVNLLQYDGLIQMAVHMNHKDGMFKDIRMRQALAQAINREDMLMVGVEGVGKIASYPGNHEGKVGDPQLGDVWGEAYPYDPAKAAELVAECGYKGAPVTIYTYADEPYPALATVLQNQLSSIGLNASVQQMERSALVDKVMVNQDFELTLVRRAGATYDIDQRFSNAMHTDSIGPTGNWSIYSNPVADDLIVKASIEQDNEVRKQYYAELVKIFVDDIVYCPLYSVTSSRAYSTKFEIEPGLARYDLIQNYKWAD